METTVPRLPKLQPWYWTVPRIAVGLFVLAVISLLWLLHRQEVEEQRASLIGDSLWVEQNLHFNLSRSQEHLQQLGQDFFGAERGDGNFGARIRSFLLNNPGIAYVQVLDADGLPLRRDPGVVGEAAQGENPRTEPVRQAFRRYGERWGEPPKVVLMQNHGLIALGATPKEVLSTTAMWVKTARVLVGTYALGGPHYLSEENVARIQTRPDEKYRQKGISGA